MFVWASSFGAKAMYFIVTASGVNISNADSAAALGPQSLWGPICAQSQAGQVTRLCWHGLALLSTDCRWNPLRLKYLS